MADNKNLRDQHDRSRVAGDEDYEIEHIASKLGCSVDEVKQAIKNVGNSRERIEEFLKDKDKRS